jgi:hypothetical protein
LGSSNDWIREHRTEQDTAGRGRGQVLDERTEENDKNLSVYPVSRTTSEIETHRHVNSYYID